jgi:CRISPR-associated protein (TIGR02584 family)
MNKKRQILVAGMGTSPAVLTNAVWALAHQREPVVPDEIVVFITKNGKTLLKKSLFDGGVWADMLKCLAREGVNVEGKLMFGETSIRSIPDVKGNEIDDLRTGEDNLRAADFMLAQLRQYTEDSGTELHVSIAGGRKTMSALLLSCMTLLGRECDKVYHVLLPSEFEGGTEPAFYFPKKGEKYKSRLTGKSYPGAKVQSELFEVPFVRMRGWCRENSSTDPLTGVLNAA